MCVLGKTFLYFQTQNRENWKTYNFISYTGSNNNFFKDFQQNNDCFSSSLYINFSVKISNGYYRKLSLRIITASRWPNKPFSGQFILLLKVSYAFLGKFYWISSKLTAVRCQNKGLFFQAKISDILRKTDDTFPSCILTLRQ